MSKFKQGDLIIGVKDGLIKNTPFVILGEHTFPDGKKAYRYRSCLPQYDIETNEECWSKNDGYNHQEYLDEYELLWRRK